MRRRNVSDVDDVPGRKFGSGLRRLHNQMRRVDDDTIDDDVDGDVVVDGASRRRNRLYSKVLRVVETRTSVSLLMYIGTFVRKCAPVF